MWATVVSLQLLVLFVIAFDDLQDAIEHREQLLRKELDMMLGSDIVLSDSEQKANEIIMKLKHHELDGGLENPGQFNVSKHFFSYKDEIKKSPLFHILRQMPKGALLHTHDTGVLSPDYNLKLTYMDNLYVCFEENDIRFHFSLDTPKDTCETRWQLMNEARFSSGDVEKFDADIRSHFSLVIDNPHEVYTDINAVWKRFQYFFIATHGLLTYKPIWEQYFYDSLKAVREDNIMYLEVRSVLPELYDLYGNKYDAIATAQSYKDVLDRFMNDYPDFYGAKLIYAPLRLVDRATIRGKLEIAKEIKRKFPDFFAGFDIVGQEDLGAPSKTFLPEFVEYSNEVDYFFHAGETNWNGMSTDENLFDAILLDTRRIGHAFALIKHPHLLNEVVRKDIGLEVNVVSNSVLKLVEDVRNHPLAAFLAQNLPVVLGSDDNGVWESDPLTHDFYVAFLGVSSRHADLRVLKKLALNSLYYSAYKNKDKIVHEFEIRWTRFIHDTIKYYR
ncbi:adenosine deaminase 2-like [Amyelois transitella]|uniref:adenosine deaminase 2-like n=1 Tax=Amyelois transitella TaxID=680683 RepID=UPI00299003BA|nr:adenosine deaminase 2-like [Amyelois transitella]